MVCWSQLEIPTSATISTVLGSSDVRLDRKERIRVARGACRIEEIRTKERRPPTQDALCGLPSLHRIHGMPPHRAEDTRLSLTQQQLSNVCEFVAIDCAQSPSRCDAISSTWTRCRHNVAERKCVACSWQRDLLQARSTRRQLPLQCLF